LSEFLYLDLVLNFYTQDHILLKKLMGWWVCPACNKNFNLANISENGYDMPPILPRGSD